MAGATLRCGVLVVGAGVAGISAAVRAAREGAHTVLIERDGTPGGAVVAGMHRFICGLYANGDDLPEVTLNGGIAAEICTSLRKLAPEKKVQRMGRVHVLPFSTRDLVSTLRLLCEGQRELEVLYATRAVALEMEGNRIGSVSTEGERGRVEIVPDAVIDCSGDGVVIQMSGAQCHWTPPEQRQLAGFSFRVEGLQDPDEMLPVRVPYHLARAAGAGRIPHHLRFTTFTPGDDPAEGVCRLAIAQLGGDGDERAREEALLVHRVLSEALAAFEGSRIAEMSPRVLDREGPRLRGRYTLTADDVLRAGKFRDGVVKNAWPIELWDPAKGPRLEYLEPGEHYEVPLRCLEPEGLENCWSAGRCISATREALGSTRVAGTCIALGDRAGRAAAAALDGAHHVTDCR
jgi:hypothetical protein